MRHTPLSTVISRRIFSILMPTARKYDVSPRGTYSRAPTLCSSSPSASTRSASSASLAAAPSKLRIADATRLTGVTGTISAISFMSSRPR